MMNYFIYFLLIGQATYCNAGFLSWLGWEDISAPNVSYRGIPLIKVPYEELPPEDKFLVEASRISGMDLSDVDACQQRVILRLKSCASMNEDQLSKLSIALLNCHFEAEGRATIKCSDDMSLKACTQGMDSFEWDAYHAMANRARAVCYAARQNHFRAVAELSVNRLMEAAGDAIVKLNNAQVENTLVKGASGVTLKEIEGSQRRIFGTFRSAAVILSSVSKSMEKIKVTLQENEESFARLTKRFANTIEVADNEINRQINDAKVNMKEINKQIKTMASVLGNLSSSLNSEVSVADSILSALKELNVTISYASVFSKAWSDAVSYSTMFTFDSSFERVGDTTPGAVILVHCLWLAVCMLLMVFLSVPYGPRILLLMTVPANMVAAVVGGESASLPVLYTGLVFICSAYYLIACVSRYHYFLRRPVAGNVNNDNHRTMNYFDRVSHWMDLNQLRTRQNGNIPQTQPAEDESRSLTESLRRRNGRDTPARSVSSRSQCEATSASTLQRCRNYTIMNSRWCSIHRST